MREQKGLLEERLVAIVALEPHFLVLVQLHVGRQVARSRELGAAERTLFGGHKNIITQCVLFFLT